MAPRTRSGSGPRPRIVRTVGTALPAPAGCVRRCPWPRDVRPVQHRLGPQVVQRRARHRGVEQYDQGYAVAGGGEPAGCRRSRRARRPSALRARRDRRPDGRGSWSMASSAISSMEVRMVPVPPPAAPGSPPTTGPGPGRDPGAGSSAPCRGRRGSCRPAGRTAHPPGVGAPAHRPRRPPAPPVRRWWCRRGSARSRYGRRTPARWRSAAGRAPATCRRGPPARRRHR